MRYCFNWEDISSSPLEMILVTRDQEGLVVGRIERIDMVDNLDGGPTKCYRFQRVDPNDPFYQHAYDLDETKAIAEVMLKKIGYTIVEKPREKLKSMF